MRKVASKGLNAAVLGLTGMLYLSATVTPAEAQDLFIYPKEGQSEEQQSRDRYECHSWAVQQTGYDPSNPPQVQTGNVEVPQPEATEGGVLRGAARGATIGVVGGAIAGDAGEGAAIGAATGALLGGMRRRDQRRRQEQEQRNYEQQLQQQQAQQQQTNTKARDAYNRAMTACLEARGYSVN